MHGPQEAMNTSSGTNQDMVSAELAHEATQYICTVFAKRGRKISWKEMILISM